MLVKIIIFAVGSIGTVFLSLRSASQLHSYGLLRFFAFESILILLLLNGERWFRDPFSFTQIFSWLLLIASAVMVSSGFYMLRRFGRPKAAIEDTVVLVTSGIYRYIRHPLYSSLIYLAWGAFLKNISIISLILVLAVSILSIVIAKIEEKEDIRKFGEKYLAYMQATKMFIPFII